MTPWKERLLRSMGEGTFNRFSYYYIHVRGGRIPRRLDLRRPRTFNEKTIWLKLHHRHPGAHVLADKILVKGLVRERLGEKYLIPTIAVYDRAEEIDFDRLPDSFVLKANHGSGWNVLCRDKATLDREATRARLAAWLGTNYYDIGKEYQYRDIVPRILCEEYLENSEAEPLVDYKIHCFAGKPAFVQVDLDRFTHHTRNFYDLDWNLLPFTTLYPLGTRKLPRPDALDEMLDVAEKLSAGLKLARIDLYWYRGAVYFGEITLHHGGGFEPFTPARYDRLLGEYITL